MTDKIHYKKYACKRDNEPIQLTVDNMTNLYVVLTRKCNANCPFCEYRQGKSKIDTQKYKELLLRITDEARINMIHFTGGEPSLETHLLKELCDITKEVSSEIKTSINTNGRNLGELAKIQNLDNIALSRHDIDDKANQELFKTDTVATKKDIQEFPDKGKLHLSCNLIKGHIDSINKILNYLEFVSELGIQDVGIVSLMSVNKFCKEHYIDFESLNIQDKLTKTRCFRNYDEATCKTLTCKCENYLYQAKNISLISLYHRYAIRSNEVSDMLVYEDNILRQGFNGEIINLEQRRQ